MAIIRQVCPIVKCGVRVCELARGPALTWIVFQVGQQPRVWPAQPQELAQSCGSQRQQVRPARGTYSSAMRATEWLQIVHRPSLMSVRWGGVSRSGLKAKGRSAERSETSDSTLSVNKQILK